MGCASIPKMTVLPRLLYKMQTIPIRLLPTFFEAYRRMCKSFLWGTLACFGWAKLVITKSKGGIGLPDLQRYYWTVQMTRVVDWRIHNCCKDWVNLEWLISETELCSIPWFSKKSVLPNLHTHPLIGTTLHAFDSYSLSVKCMCFSATACSIIPIRGNPDFLPGLAKTYLSQEWPYAEMQVKHFFRRSKFIRQQDLAVLSNTKSFCFWSYILYI